MADRSRGPYAAFFAVSALYAPSADNLRTFSSFAVVVSRGKGQVNRMHLCTTLAAVAASKVEFAISFNG